MPSACAAWIRCGRTLRCGRIRGGSVMNRERVRMAMWLSALPIVAVVAAQGPPPAGQSLTDPFKGVTANGTVQPGLFTVRSTGVSTAPVRDAAGAFLASLTPEQKGKTTFAADDIEWRDWNNIHRYQRKGVSFKEITHAQKAKA